MEKPKPGAWERFKADVLSAPSDLMKEANALLAGKRTYEVRQKIDAMKVADATSTAAAEKALRDRIASMNDFLGGPSPSERGAVTRDQSPTYAPRTIDQARRADALRVADGSLAGLKPGTEAYARSLAARDAAMRRNQPSSTQAPY